MANKDTTKTYNQVDNKLFNNWQDVKYLIALHNRLLEKIKELDQKVDRAWTSINNITEDDT